MKKMIFMREYLTFDFWRWFKRSRVIDERGEPLVVYHGSPIDWHSDPKAQFSLGKFGTTTDTGDVGEGFYFADSEVEARSYGKYIGKFYLSIQNPFKIGRDYVNESNQADRRIMNSELPGILPTVQKLADIMSNVGIKPPSLEGTKYSYVKVYDLVSSIGNSNFRKGMIKAGYDGIYWLGEWVAYFPEQIKSVDNIGVWEIGNPNIYENKR